MKLAKIYEPQEYEPGIYNLWEQADAFAPKKVEKGSARYSLVVPPPNANGSIHIGTALTIGLEDVLARYHRMKGEATLFIPGADHAGFETWVVFERDLEKQGKSRFDYTRDELYKMVWDFVAKHRGNMEVQVRELGASVDWHAMTFTLDKKVIDTAYRTFKKMWDDGLIYRGLRPVNYCTKHQTGFADIEVVYEDRITPLYYLKYGPCTLATTRPETTFGDTGIAVHPDDKRYKKYVGKELTVEGVNGPLTVKVVADEAVDPSFGTGAVKVTPAHSFTDWEIAQRHGLNALQVIDFDGKLNKYAGRFAGMTVLEARKAVVAALNEKGLIEKTDAQYKNRIGVCYKCKTVIEPMPLEQWFVKTAPLAEPVIRALEAEEVTFTPDNKRAVLINYLESVRDWNISRQPPWGIPIPAFQNVDDPDDWIFDARVDQQTITVNNKTYKRDPDTFDTWFSSGQWPFITTDALEAEASERAEFYPLDVMETGRDLLFPWVARMLMLGYYVTGQAPFRHAYLHGLVLDEHGQKMSKSRGNVINPQELIEQYGSDAVRMGLLASRSAGIDQAFSPGSLLAARNFCNKLWNMARYIEDKLSEGQSEMLAQPETLADHWVLERLAHAAHETGRLLEQYRFSEAYETVYHLVWNDVADWYIEASKVTLNSALLEVVLATVLKLMHPFAPFLTETIWQTLGREPGFLMHATWPERAGEKASKYNAPAAQKFGELQALISEARFVSAELGQGKQRLLYRKDSLIAENSDLIQRVGRLAAIEEVSEPRGLRLAVSGHEAWLDIDAATLSAHRSKLEARLEEVSRETQRLEARLANDRYVAGAPPTIVQQTRDQLAEKRLLKQRLERELTVVK